MSIPELQEVVVKCFPNRDLPDEASRVQAEPHGHVSSLQPLDLVNNNTTFTAAPRPRDAL